MQCIENMQSRMENVSAINWIDAVTYWMIIDWCRGKLSVFLYSLGSPSVPTGLLKLARPTDYPPVRPIQIYLQIEIQIYDTGLVERVGEAHEHGL
jgi:hypothetical protein